MRKSATPSGLGFTAGDRLRLTHAMQRAGESRLFRRIQAVLLIAKAHSFRKAAEITGLSLSSVYKLVKRYLVSHQVEDFQDGERCGRPRVASAVTDSRLLRELRRNPLRLGYRTNVWTVELLAQHLSERYGCPINPHTLKRRMKQIGLRCKRPRYVYAEKDPHRAQKKGPSSGN
jgi:transposase